MSESVLGVMSYICSVFDEAEFVQFWDDPQFTQEELAWLEQRAAERAALPKTDLENAVSRVIISRFIDNQIR
jgi:hypothetical protein